MANTLYQYIVGATDLRGNRSRKVIKKGYYVLTNTKMRAYLVENGFMDSSVDTPIIITEEHANKTVAGILQWLKDEFSLSVKPIHAIETEGSVDKPLTAVTDPADLAVGVEVIVDGYVYGTGIGKGRSILKKGDHMFITDYAGKGYPYCWGVAKKAGGKRQGWASADDLTIVAGEDESLVDGSSVEYFKACKYSGSSIVAALKSIGENSSYAYRKTIAETNGIASYRGTAAQNVQMVTLLRDGKLIKP